MGRELFEYVLQNNHRTVQITLRTHFATLKEKLLQSWTFSRLWYAVWMTSSLCCNPQPQVNTLTKMEQIQKNLLFDFLIIEHPQCSQDHLHIGDNNGVHLIVFPDFVNLTNSVQNPLLFVCYESSCATPFWQHVYYPIHSDFLNIIHDIVTAIPLYKRISLFRTIAGLFHPGMLFLTYVATWLLYTFNFVYKFN